MIIRILTIISLTQATFTSGFEVNLCDLCHQNTKQPEFSETSVNNSEFSCYIFPLDKNISCATSKNNSDDVKPEPPTDLTLFWYKEKHIYLAKESNNSALFDLNITFGPPQNALIDYVEGFRLDFGDSAVDVCLGNRLNYFKNRDLALNFDCFTNFTDEVFEPGRNYKVKVRSYFFYISFYKVFSNILVLSDNIYK